MKYSLRNKNLKTYFFKKITLAQSLVIFWSFMGKGFQMFAFVKQNLFPITVNQTKIIS